MSNPKYYYGTELKWSTEDVELIAEQMDIQLTQEQMVQVLIATFEDNEYIGQMINQEIQNTIEHIKESEK
jgi:predicted RNA methylase